VILFINLAFVNKNFDLILEVDLADDKTLEEVDFVQKVANFGLKTQCNKFKICEIFVLKEIFV